MRWVYSAMFVVELRLVLYHFTVECCCGYRGWECKFTSWRENGCGGLFVFEFGRDVEIRFKLVSGLSGGIGCRRNGRRSSRGGERRGR